MRTRSSVASPLLLVLSGALAAEDTTPPTTTATCSEVSHNAARDEGDVLLNAALQACVEEPLKDAAVLHRQPLASEDRNKNVAIDPLYVPALFTAGFIYSEQSKSEAAIESYRNVIGTDETSATAHLNLGVFPFQSGSEDVVQQSGLRT